MSRGLKKRVKKLEEGLDQKGFDCEFTIVFNPPKEGKQETEKQGGENQQDSSENAKKPLPTKMIYY